MDTDVDVCSRGRRRVLEELDEELGINSQVNMAEKGGHDTGEFVAKIDGIRLMVDNVIFSQEL